MAAPTLINLPPPPSDPTTPSEIPGTPNSTTTSMSELSTVAIKDGQRGHPHHHSHHPTQSSHPSLDAERADRISRLAGLERVATARQTSNQSLPVGATASHPQGYFDPPPSNNMAKERSTVGSASATGSVGGRTTWASSSEANDATDKMSESVDQDLDMETSSTGGFSDEGNASLVGFGEGASSTVSGPVSASQTTIRTPRHSTQASLSMTTPKGSSQNISSTTVGAGPVEQRDARMVDGMTYDTSTLDTAPIEGRAPPTNEHTMVDADERP